MSYLISDGTDTVGQDTVGQDKERKKEAMTSSLDILRAIIHRHNYTIVKLLDEHNTPLSSKEIQTKANLTRKQLYMSLAELKKVEAINKFEKKSLYTITPIAKDILKHVKAIEEIESKKLGYRVRELVEAAKNLSSEDKQKILKNLKL